MRFRQNGITLIELMVVVVIVGILAAIAYPSYRDQVRRSNRTEAKVALEARAQALEKCFTRYMAYDAAGCNAAQVAANGPTPDGHYNVALTTITPTTFVLTATPQGGQASDAQCLNFTLDETGARGVSTGNAAACW